MDSFLKISDNLFELMQLSRKNLFNVTNASAKLNLTQTQIYIIFALHKLNKTTATKLSSILKVNKSNLSPQLDELVKLKYVMREEDNKDRRRTYLYLTDEGWDIMKSLRFKGGEIISEELMGISDEEIKKLQEYTDKTISILKKYLNTKEDDACLK